MMKNVRTLDIPIAEDTRLVIKVDKVEKTDKQYPDKLMFAIQYLYFKDGKWIQIARIDNSDHEGRREPHIHRLGRIDVEFRNITPEEAQEKVIEIGDRIKKDFILGGN